MEVLEVDMTFSRNEILAVGRITNDFLVTTRGDLPLYKNATRILVTEYDNYK